MTQKVVTYVITDSFPEQPFRSLDKMENSVNIDVWPVNYPKLWQLSNWTGWYMYYVIAEKAKLSRIFFFIYFIITG